MLSTIMIRTFQTFGSPLIPAPASTVVGAAALPPVVAL